MCPKLLLLEIALYLIITKSNGFRLNITKVENCQDIKLDEGYQVELLTTTYDYVDGICDTIHGTYIVRTIDSFPKELLITVYQCPNDSTGTCNDNPKEFHEKLHCERFHGDDSGPWYMISSAMRGSRCGEELGNFNLESATMKPEYLVNYINIDKENSRYRLRMFFHRKDDVDLTHIRGCLSLEFTVFS